MADSNILPLSSDQQQPQTGAPETEEQTTDIAVLGLDAISREMQRLAPDSGAAHEDAAGVATVGHTDVMDEALPVPHGEPEHHTVFTTPEQSEESDHPGDALRF